MSTAVLSWISAERLTAGPGLDIWFSVVFAVAFPAAAAYAAGFLARLAGWL